MSRLAISVLVCLAVWTTSAVAQAWPSKPIRWIVPFPPGGSTDISARTVAEHLRQALGQSPIVENRPGAAGHIAMEYGAKSAPDGYTLLVSSDGMTSAPHLYPALGFDPLKDFVPVVQLMRYPVVLAAHPSLGVTSMAELIQLVKARPGLAYASSGTGSPQNIAGEWLGRLAGIKLVHVPYKGGGQAVTDLVGGQVQLASLGPGPLIPHYRAGKVKLLAQATRERSPLLPDVPTYGEAGIKGLIIEQWVGLFFPAGTPNNIVVRLNAAVVKALADPRIRERYAQSGLEPAGGTPEQFAALVRADYEKYGRLVRELNIRVD